MKSNKSLITAVLIILFYSCGSGPSTSSDLEPFAFDSDKESNVVKEEVTIQDTVETTYTVDSNFIIGTKIYGEINDTSWIALEDVRISTAPGTIEVMSNENGRFELVSDQFMSDLAYDIRFMHRDYKTKTISSFYPNIDENNELDLILMIPLPVENDGDGPGRSLLPPTPPGLIPGGGRE